MVILSQQDEWISLFVATFSPKQGYMAVNPLVAVFIHPNGPVLPQDEEKFLMAVEEVQKKLQDQKNQLLEKKNQVDTAKAELDQKIKSVQGINKYELFLHYCQNWYQLMLLKPPQNPKSLCQWLNACEYKW